MADPIILALDLSTRTGYACGRRFERPPVLRVGTWLLPSVVNGSVGPTLSALDQRLARAIDEWDVERIVYESPLPAGQQTYDATARMLIALPGIVEKVGHECGIDVLEGNMSSARKLVLGRGRGFWDKDLAAVNRSRARAKSRDHIKRLALDWATSQGIVRVDDNGADAAVLHRYTTTLLAGHVTA